MSDLAGEANIQTLCVVPDKKDHDLNEIPRPSVAMTLKRPRERHMCLPPICIIPYHKAQTSVAEKNQTTALVDFKDILENSRFALPPITEGRFFGL